MTFLKALNIKISLSTSELSKRDEISLLYNNITKYYYFPKQLITKNMNAFILRIRTVG